MGSYYIYPAFRTPDSGLRSSKNLKTITLKYVSESGWTTINKCFIIFNKLNMRLTFVKEMGSSQLVFINIFADKKILLFLFNLFLSEMDVDENLASDDKVQVNKGKYD